MTKKRNKSVDGRMLWRLFLSTFSLSMFTFGGGYVMVPLMRKKFVQHLKWIDEEEMLDLVAIAQSSPGAMAVNTSILVGYRMAGILGSFISLAGTVLPPLIILSVISLFYTAFRDNRYVGFLLRAMQAGVAAVIVDVVIDMAGDVIKKKKVLLILLLISVFILSAFLKMNIMILILICGFTGVLITFIAKKTGKDLF